MRILIDLQGAQTSSRFRGIGRYSLGITKGILRNSQGHEILLLLNGFHPDQIESIRSELCGLISLDRLLVWEGVGPTGFADPDNRWRQQASELIRESFITQLQPDVVLITTLFEGYLDDFAASIGALDDSVPVAVIFYDLIPFLYPDHYLSDPVISKWYAERLETLKKADFLLSISKASMSEAIDHLGVQENQIVNISSAISEDMAVHDSAGDSLLLKRLGIRKPFLMYTSATDARKNHLRLIEAYAKLDPSIRKGHQLVFAGGMPVDHRLHFQAHAKKQGLSGKELIFTGELTDDELKALYCQCVAFVFPSWHEGFGLPILEAMQFNKAVIASNQSSIPEILEHDEALFDPFDVDSISGKIHLVLTDSQFRESLERNSRERKNIFSWDRSAKTAIDALENWISANGAVGDRSSLKGSGHQNTDKLIERVAQLKLPHIELDLLRASEAICQNSRSPDQRQLLVDISVLVEHDARTGIQRVVRNILREWLLKPPLGFVIEPIYTSTDKPYRYARQFIARFFDKPHDQSVIDDVVEFTPGDIYLGLDLLYSSLAVNHRHFYQKMRNHGVKVQFVVYDLLPILLPQHVVEGAAEGHSQWLELAVQSDGVVCISQAVASELAQWLSDHAIKTPKFFCINWFHLGGDQEKGATQQTPISTLDRASLKRVFDKQSFLCVGTLEPRKGHTQVLAAFELLWAQGCDINLVVVGKQGWKMDDLAKRLEHHPENGRHLFWFKGIGDSVLEEIYRHSSCLIAASEGEGFGLPLIEAAHHGVPIIARNLPVFHEVAGEFAFYFDGLAPNDLAKAVQDWIALADKGNIPASKGMPFLTWSQSANQLLVALGIDVAAT